MVIDSSLCNVATQNFDWNFFLHPFLKVLSFDMQIINEIPKFRSFFQVNPRGPDEGVVMLYENELLS